jgi:two-component system heavy metal sensor histidine kinase CusS
LGLSGALVAAAASGLLGTYLYRSFEQQLQQRDDVQLLGKLRQLRQLLGHSGTPALLRSQADYLRDTMSGESNALIEIYAAPAQGSGLLLSINAPGLVLPQPQPLALGQAAWPQDLLHWQTPAGIPAAGLSAWARLGADEVEIRLARLYPERSALLASYRLRIAVASLGAGGLAAALMLALIWRGLAPLRRLRAQAEGIGPQSLAARLHAPDAPPELRPLVDGVNGMLARLEQGYAQLNQFAADLAHELRTPLATLTGQSQVMLSRPRTEAEHAQLLESQLQELDRLNRMVDSLLFLARSEHQTVAGSLQRQPLSAADEMARQADYFADLADERGLRIQCHGDAALLAEPQLLRRALANVLANALRHARPESVIELRARVEPEGDTVLEVINEGAPLPPEQLPRLFDRFYRADAARSGEAGGSGLGLAIVQAIMVLHGGSARVWQDEGGRISFALRFPRAQDVRP